jgi:hypothetical protein
MLRGITTTRRNEMKKLHATSYDVLKRVKLALAGKDPEIRGDDVFYFGELERGLHVKVTEIKADNYAPTYVVREADDGDCVLCPSYPNGETDFPAIAIRAGAAINSPVFWPIPTNVVDRLNGQAMRLVEEALA